MEELASLRSIILLCTKFCYNKSLEKNAIYVAAFRCYIEMISFCFLESKYSKSTFVMQQKI